MGTPIKEEAKKSNWVSGHDGQQGEGSIHSFLAANISYQKERKFFLNRPTIRKRENCSTTGSMTGDLPRNIQVISFLCCLLYSLKYQGNGYAGLLNFSYCSPIFDFILKVIITRRKRDKKWHILFLTIIFDMFFFGACYVTNTDSHWFFNIIVFYFLKSLLFIFSRLLLTSINCW